MIEPNKEKLDAVKVIYKAEVKEACLDTLKFVPIYLLSIVFISFVGTFLVKSEEFVQYGSFFNGLFMAIVFLSNGRKRREKFSKQIQTVLKK